VSRISGVKCWLKDKGKPLRLPPAPRHKRSEYRLASTNCVEEPFCCIGAPCPYPLSLRWMMLISWDARSGAHRMKEVGEWQALVLVTPRHARLISFIRPQISSRDRILQPPGLLRRSRTSSARVGARSERSPRHFSVHLMGNLLPRSHSHTRKRGDLKAKSDG